MTDLWSDPEPCELPPAVKGGTSTEPSEKLDGLAAVVLMVVLGGWLLMVGILVAIELTG